MSHSRQRPADRKATETDPLWKEAAKTDGDWSFGNPVSFVRELNEHFGMKILVLLFVVQHLLKGFSIGLWGAASTYLYKSYSVPAPTMQIYSSVAATPWAMKPVIGLVSDVCPIWGYRKAPYFLLTTIFAIAGFSIIGFVPQTHLAVSGVVVCMYVLNLQNSTCDLLSEAKYAEKIQANPKYGPDLMTYVWFGLTAATLCASMISGSMIATFGPKMVFLVCMVPASAVLIPVLLGYLEERPMSDADLQGVRDRFAKQKEACALCIMMLVGTLALSVCGIAYKSPGVNATLAICIAAILLVGFSLVLSPSIAKFNAYSMLQGSLSLSTSGATFYFYTDSAEQYPEGPHFTPFFYNSVIGVTGTLCSLLGIFCYSRYMSNWNYRHIFIVSNVIFSVLSAFDVLLFTRMNVRLGIPDHVFVLSSSVLEEVVNMWMWMPQVVIMSYLCPKGMEATMYALLAGCSNLGSNISANVGALLLQRLDVMPSGAIGESKQFENLWLASAISTALPATTVVLIFWLVPDAKQGEEVIGADVDVDATTGSLWRRCMDSV